jgi:hypothetical protein
MTKRFVVLAVASTALAFSWSGCSGGSGSGGTGGGSSGGGSAAGGGSAGGGSHTGGGSAGGGSAGGGSAGGGSAGGGSAGGGSAGGGSAGGGSAGGGSGTAPDGGTLNGCRGLLLCVSNCNDMACDNACLADSTSHAQDLLNTLGDCINNICFSPAADAGMDAGIPCADQNSPACNDCYASVLNPDGGSCAPAQAACGADTP